MILKCIRHNKDVKSCSGLIRLRHEIRGVLPNTPVTLTLLWCATISVSRSALLKGVKMISGLHRDINDMIYLLTAIGLSPGGSSTVHIYTQTIHRTIQNKQYIEQHSNWKSADRAPSWLVIPWHLPYNRGKSTEKRQSR